jgi:hypothetical protein
MWLVFPDGEELKYDAPAAGTPTVMAFRSAKRLHLRKGKDMVIR